jgi:hypothetical protein
VLKNLEQKHLDNQELAKLLSAERLERERLSHPDAPPSKGVASFFSTKVKELAGKDIGTQKAEKIQRVDTKIVKVRWPWMHSCG